MLPEPVDNPGMDLTGCPVGECQVQVAIVLLHPGSAACLDVGLIWTAAQRDPRSDPLGRRHAVHRTGDDQQGSRQGAQGLGIVDLSVGGGEAPRAHHHSTDAVMCADDFRNHQIGPAHGDHGPHGIDN